jgi:methionine-rich copper-binding protein CopC
VHSNAFALGLIVVATLALAGSSGTAFAHVRPQTTNPASGAYLDTPPAHVVLDYDGVVDPSGTGVMLLDSAGNQVAATNDSVASNHIMSVSPTAALAPGPYTVAWTTLDAADGHVAQGFYTFVVDGGPVGIIAGQAQTQAPAANLMATLTVTAAPDGGSLLRVDLDNPTGVERVRIRLSRPDLGEDLLDTHPSGDGGWELTANELAVPGAWHAVAVVRRTNIFDDAQAVIWHNVSSDDGDPNDGAFVFMVAGTSPAAPASNVSAASNAPAAAPVACIDNGQLTPGINDVRVNTYCQRQAIRDQYRGQIDEKTFNFDLANGVGLEHALSDAMDAKTHKT